MQRHPLALGLSSLRKWRARAGVFGLLALAAGACDEAAPPFAARALKPPVPDAGPPDASMCRPGRSFDEDPATPLRLASDPWADDWRFGDFDGDGQLDVLASSHLLGGQGPQTFEAGQTTYRPFSFAVHTGFRKDGDVAYGVGAETELTPIQTCIWTCVDAHDLAIGDLDGDGDLDIAAVGAMAGRLVVYLNDGHANFTRVADLATPTHPRRVALGDFDHDGDLDVAVFSAQARVAMPDRYRLSVFENTDGSGRFADDPAALTTVDLDMDWSDDPDDATGWRLGHAFDVVHAPSGRGSADLIAIGARDRLAVWSYSLDTGLYEVESLPDWGGAFELGDFDHDGEVDLIGHGAARILLSAFVPSHRREPRDNDGFARLVAAIAAGDYGVSFKNRFGRAPAQGVRAQFAGDIDGDGLDDLVLALGGERPFWDQDRYHVVVFGQSADANPAGTPWLTPAALGLELPVPRPHIDWRARTLYPLVASVDVDGDGYRDLVRRGERGLVLLRNQGYRSIEARRPYIEVATPRSARSYDERVVAGDAFATPVHVREQILRDVAGHVLDVASGPPVDDDQHMRVRLALAGLAPDESRRVTVAVRNHCYESNAYELTIVGPPRPLPAPTIASVSSDVLRAGDFVTIRGTNFVSGEVSKILLYDADSGALVAEEPITAPPLTDTEIGLVVPALYEVPVDCTGCVQRPQRPPQRVRVGVRNAVAAGAAQQRDVQANFAVHYRALAYGDPYIAATPEIRFDGLGGFARTLTDAECHEYDAAFGGAGSYYDSTRGICTWRDGSGRYSREAALVDLGAADRAASRTGATFSVAAAIVHHFCSAWGGGFCQDETAIAHTLLEGRTLLDRPLALRDPKPLTFSVFASATGMVITAGTGFMADALAKMSLVYPRPDAGAPLSRPVRPTRYYATDQARHPRTNETVPVYDAACHELTRISQRYWNNLCIEGTGYLADGRVLNVDGHHDCGVEQQDCVDGHGVTRATDQTFRVLPITDPRKWGVGNAGSALVPFRSLARDIHQGDYAYGQTLYVPAWDGVWIPETQVPGHGVFGGFVHDGCWVVTDSGGFGARDPNHARLDFFVANETGAAFARSVMSDSVDYPVREGGERCKHVMPLGRP